MVLARFAHRFANRLNSRARLERCRSCSRSDSGHQGLLSRHDGNPKNQMQQTFCALAASVETGSSRIVPESRERRRTCFSHQQRRSLQRFQFVAPGFEACWSQVGHALAELAYPQTNSRYAASSGGRFIAGAQAQLGHSKMSTTLEIYTLPIPEQQRATIEKLSVLMANDGRKCQNSGSWHQKPEELPLASQQNEWIYPPGRSPTPTTSPLLLMSVANVYVPPGKSPRSVTLPLANSAA
jgi:hypothetical protein